MAVDVRRMETERRDGTPTTLSAVLYVVMVVAFVLGLLSFADEVFATHDDCTEVVGDC
jgi:hypothetical protein